MSYKFKIVTYNIAIASIVLASLLSLNPIIGKLIFSHFFMVIFVATIFFMKPVKYFRHGRHIIYLLILSFVAIFLFSDLGSRFFNDAIKILLFFSFLLALLDRPQFSRKLLEFSAWICLIGLSLLLLISEDQFSGYGGRLYISIDSSGKNIISPNTIGFLLNISLVVMLNNRAIFRFIFIPLILLLLILTGSRGALLGCCLIIIFFIISRLQVEQILLYSILLLPLFALAGIGFLLKVDFVSIIESLRLLDATGSGRIILWAFLLSNLYTSPINFLFGFGPGAINFEIYPGHSLVSAHSGYLEILYNFGLIGLALFFIFIFKAVKSYRLLSLDVKLYLILILSYMLTEDLFGSHTLFLLSAISSLIVTNIKYAKKDIHSRI